LTSMPGKTLRGGLWLLGGLCFAGGLAGLSVSITGPILVDIARSYHVSEALAGQLMTVASLAGVIGTLAVSPLLDHFGRRNGITASLVAMALACLVCALAPSFAVLAAGYCVVGLSGYMLFAQVLAAVGDLYRGELVSKAMGWVTFGNVGFTMVGMPVAGQLAARLSWPWGFTFLGICALPTAMMAWRLIPAGSKTVRHEGLSYSTAFARLHRSRTAITMLATLGLTCASYYGFSTYMAVVGKEMLAASTAAIGTVFSVRYLGAMLLGLSAGLVLRVADWRFTAAAAVVCAVISLAVYLVPGSVLLMGVDNLIYGFAVGAIDVGINAMLAEVDAGGRGVVMAMRSVMDSLGGVVGPALGGLALALGGLSLAASLFALLALAAALVLLAGRQPSPVVICK